MKFFIYRYGPDSINLPNKMTSEWSLIVPLEKKNVYEARLEPSQLKQTFFLKELNTVMKLFFCKITAIEPLA